MVEIPMLQERSCGDCTKCCEGYLEATIYGKSMFAGSPCHFAKPGVGCSIYNDRPKEPCQTYKCLWMSDPATPEWIKPSLSGVIIDDSQVAGMSAIRVNEAGKKLPSEILSWAIKYAVANNRNIMWKIEGGMHWVGSAEFNEAMLAKFGKQEQG